MDFDRPSLRNKVKGRRQLPLFDAGDSELEIERIATWENDRNKKKVKKLSRGQSKR